MDSVEWEHLATLWKKKSYQLVSSISNFTVVGHIGKWFDWSVVVQMQLWKCTEQHSDIKIVDRKKDEYDLEKQ